MGVNKEFNKRTEELGLEFYNTRSDKVFTDLYKHLYLGYYNYVMLNYTKDKMIVDEILSDTFHNIYFYIDSYKPKYNFRNYFFTMLVREALQGIGNNKKHLLRYISIEAFRSKDGQNYEYMENRFKEPEVRRIHTELGEKQVKEIIEAFKDLNLEHYEVLIDKFINGFTYEELRFKYPDTYAKKLVKYANITIPKMTIIIKRVLDMTELERKLLRTYKDKGRLLNHSYELNTGKNSRRYKYIIKPLKKIV